MSIILEDYNESNKSESVSKDGYIQTFPDDSLPTSWSNNDHRIWLNKKSSGDITAWHNEEGKLTHYTERSDDNRKKVITPWTLWNKTVEDKPINIWKQRKWLGCNSFYNSKEIIESNKPILIVEGEKCLHFANKNPLIKSYYLTTTWYGGVNNVYDFNFEILKNKEVYLFPDNDDPGREAMHTIAYSLVKKGITTNIKYFKLAELSNNEFSVGWDIADKFPDKYNLEQTMKPESIYWVHYKSAIDKLVWQSIKQTLKEREERKNALTLLDKYVYVQSNDMFVEVGSVNFQLSAQINNFYKHLNSNLSKELLENPKFKKAKTFITNSKYPPGLIYLKENEIPLLEPGAVLNIYKPNYIQPKEGDVSFLIDLYKEQFGSDKWEVIEQTIAYYVQYPGEKIKWALVMVSEVEGTGKGLLARIISRVKGFHNVNENANYKHLINNHNTLLIGTEVIVLNELSLGDFKSKNEGTNSLKNFVCDDYYTCNFKNKPMVKLINNTNFVLFSNDPRVLSANPGGRRYYFINIRTTEQELETMADLFDKAWSFVDSDEGAAALLYYFKNTVVIKDPKIFKRRAPKTDDLLELIEQSKHPMQKILENELKNPEYNNQVFDNSFTGILSFDELKSKLTTPDQYKKKTNYGSYSDDALYKFLSANCLLWNNKKQTKQIDINGTRNRYYILDDNRSPIPNKSYRDFEPKQLEKIIRYGYSITNAIKEEAKIFSNAKSLYQGGLDLSKLKNSKYEIEGKDKLINKFEKLKSIINRGVRDPETILNEYDFETHKEELGLVDPKNYALQDFIIKIPDMPQLQSISGLSSNVY